MKTSISRYDVLFTQSLLTGNTKIEVVGYEPTARGIPPLQDGALYRYDQITWARGGQISHQNCTCCHSRHLRLLCL